MTAVIVSHDGAGVFCCTGTRDQAEHAGRLIRSLAAEHGCRVDTDLKRWHPISEDWEDPDTPLPEGDADRAREHVALMERERAESEKLGYPEFEVRVACRSHRAAVEFAELLRNAGMPNVR